MAPDVPSLLGALNLDLDSITDPNIRTLCIGLLNIIEQQSAYLAKLEEDNRKLKDENARLKGEQGRPNVKANKSKGETATNYSSEHRRRQQKKRKQKPKKVVVDRTQHCALDREQLPEDAQYKGTETTIIQDVVFRRDNVAFERDKYYSPSERKTYLAPLPPGYQGYRFGPNVRALVLTLYYATGTSEPKVLELLDHVGVVMSAGELSNLLIRDIQLFHKEKAEIHKAGMESGPWQQIDDTSTRVDGRNYYCHVLGNPLYTSYQTMPRKDRPTVLAVLRGKDEPRYVVNEEALDIATSQGISSSVVMDLELNLPWSQELTESDFLEVFNRELPGLGQQTRRKLLEAAALASYRSQKDVPVVEVLLGDDARQFDEVTSDRALCWVHEGRHYTKLSPTVPQFQVELESFQDRFWSYYRKLREYRLAPSVEEAERLRQSFDELFSRKVAYEELSERMSKTKAKKAELLLVLTHPELPLHNNDMELGARQRARKRDVSFGARTQIGVKAWDTFQSLVATAKKLGVNVYQYFADRVQGLGQVPSLAALLREQAGELHLDGSWTAPALSG